MKNIREQTNPLYNGNKLKLGTFCTNTVNSPTLVPEMTRPTWNNCLDAAVLADRSGLEAITPIARWKGYLDGKPDHLSNDIMEAFTFSAAIAQATRYSAVFTTTHAPTIHPVAVAKMSATIDHISGGRFALNIVGGWNRREFDMFGIDLLEHDTRYVYLADFLGVLKRLWTGEEFDYRSPYFTMKGALARPVPCQSAGIPVMNAATSLTGMRFAARHADICFCMPRGDDPRAWRDEVQQYKRLARDEFGREIQVWTNASVVQSDSRAAALAYRERYTHELLDVEAIDGIIETMIKENGWDRNDPKVAFMRTRMSGGSGYPLLGCAQEIAEQLQSMAAAGIDGVLMTWIDYIDGISRFARDVMPLLVRAGLRKSFTDNG
jgi:alkanesulfonate monooxygenase SsuD/methylene tetrahydromethanopterin reductase-like flavin-dependent oxidoreductase (luciferase family)